MWDFLLRTFQILLARVDPFFPEASEHLSEVINPTEVARRLMLDDTGTLDKMNAGVPNRKYDEGKEFGEEILNVAKRLDDGSLPQRMKNILGEGVQLQIDLGL